MSTHTSWPAVPADVPVLTGTSFSQEIVPEGEGVDPASQWWCEVTLRPQRGDALARVTPPGAEPHWSLVRVTLPADDRDDAEATGRYAVDVTRQAVRLVAGEDGALEELRRLLAPSGPMSSRSSTAWYRLRAWLEGQRSGHVLAPLEL